MHEVGPEASKIQRHSSSGDQLLHGFRFYAYILEVSGQTGLGKRSHFELVVLPNAISSPGQAYHVVAQICSLATQTSSKDTSPKVLQIYDMSSKCWSPIV